MCKKREGSEKEIVGVKGKNAKEDGGPCFLHVATTWVPQITAFVGIACHLAHHVPSCFRIFGLF